MLNAQSVPPRRDRRATLDELAELAIIRQAIITGIITPQADSLCAKHYSRFISAHLAKRS